MVTNVTRNIWTFQIGLPENPLKWLNCYVIKGTDGGKNLLIDSGFNHPDCLRDLKQGMEELGISPEETDVFFTHAHSDHTGNAAALSRMGCRLIMGRVDYEYLFTAPWKTQMKRLERYGAPETVIEQVLADHDNGWLRPVKFTAELVEDGDTLSYGGYTLRCILTPGHTPGHICLYCAEEKLMFTGDHVLFDLTPNITAQVGVEDSLGEYMEGLKSIGRYEVETALPAHRTVGETGFNERLEQLYSHHVRRLEETERIVRENPGLSAYEVASRMSWSIRARDWDDFPIAQKWFALGEALAHLAHLRLSGRICCKMADNGTELYEFLHNS